MLEAKNKKKPSSRQFGRWEGYIGGSETYEHVFGNFRNFFPAVKVFDCDPSAAVVKFAADSVVNAFGFLDFNYIGFT